MFNFKHIIISLIESNNRIKDEKNINRIEKIIREELKNKYNNVFNKNYICTYNYLMLENIIRKKRSHLVELFKDYLLLDYCEEFLNKYYFLKEIPEIIYNLYLYSNKYLFYFCKPTFTDLIYNYIIFKGEEKKANLYYDNFCSKKIKNKKSNDRYNLSRTNSINNNNFENKNDNIIFDDIIRRKIEKNNSKINLSFKLSESKILINNESKMNSIKYYNENSLIYLIDEINQSKKNKNYLKYKTEGKIKNTYINDNHLCNDMYNINNENSIKAINKNKNLKSHNNNLNYRTKKKNNNSDKFIIKFINKNKRLVLPSFKNNNKIKVCYKNNKNNNNDNYLNAKINNKIDKFSNENSNRNICTKNKRKSNTCEIKKNSIIKITIDKPKEEIINNEKILNSPKNSNNKYFKKEYNLNSKKHLEERKNEYNLNLEKYINNSNNKKSNNDHLIDLSISNNNIVNQFYDKIKNDKIFGITERNSDTKKRLNSSNNKTNINSYKIIYSSLNKYAKDIKNDIFEYKKNIIKNNIFIYNNYKEDIKI